MGELVNFNEALSQKQRQAILLLAEGHTPSEVGKNLNIAAKTVSNWKCDKAFRAQLNLVQRQFFAEGVSQLKALVGQATATLRAVMADKSATHRDQIAAARTVYQFANLDDARADTGDQEADEPLFEAVCQEIDAFLKQNETS